VKSRFLDELPDAASATSAPRNQGFGSGFARQYQEAWARGSGLGSVIGVGRVETSASSIDARRSVSPTPSGPALRIGQSVFHNKFGEGVIVTLEGQGDDARAQVNFGRHGAKWLALSVAKLTPIT
jgi:DNA helicase-2/ATP-dependent DNA helicase PcrA